MKDYASFVPELKSDPKNKITTVVWFNSANKRISCKLTRKNRTH